jgi:ribosome-associated toxin RatA of RatAB toxin-antitoxin module
MADFFDACFLAEKCILNNLPAITGRRRMREKGRIRFCLMKEYLEGVSLKLSFPVMQVIKFTATIQIEAASTNVFDYTQDYGRRLQWDTFLKKADLMDGATAAGKGVKAYCVAQNGLGMVTEYVTFNRPKVTAVRMKKGPFMFKSFLGSWTFKEIAPHKTEVIFLYSFAVRFPFTLLAKFIRRHLEKNVQQRLSDLKRYIEYMPA